MQPTYKCVCGTRRSLPSCVEFFPWRWAVGAPRGSEAGVSSGLWASPFHPAAPFSTPKNSRASLATTGAPAVPASTSVTVIASATKPKARKSEKPKLDNDCSYEDESLAKDDSDGQSALSRWNRAGSNPDDGDNWREPDQTLNLEASTASSDRKLIPVLRRPRRPKIGPSNPISTATATAETATAETATAETATAETATANAAASGHPAIQRNGSSGLSAVSSTPARPVSPATGVNTKAAAAAATAAKWKARAATAAGLVPAAGMVIAAGAAAAAAAQTGTTGSTLLQADGAFRGGRVVLNPFRDANTTAEPNSAAIPQGIEDSNGSSSDSSSSSSSSSSSVASQIRRADWSSGVPMAGGADGRTYTTRLDGREDAGAGFVTPTTGTEQQRHLDELLSFLGPEGNAPTGPRAAAPLQRKVKRLRQSGRLAEALELSYAGMSHFPLVRSFWASAAALELRIGRVEAAQEVLDEALGRWPGNASLLLTLGLMHASQRDYEAASYAFRTALEREPGNAAVLHAWASAEVAKGDLVAARSRFRAATAAKPDMIYSYTSLARLEAAAGDEAAARQHFKDGHAADPTHVPLLHAWATFELNCDKQSTARRLLTQALELDPAHVPSWMAMGTLEWRQGNPAKAREVFEKGLSVVGPSAPLLSALADLELRQMNIKNARELFSRLRTSTPRHVPSLLLEAKMEHRAGNRLRAQQLYLEAAASVAAGVVRGSEGRGLQTPSPATAVAPVTSPDALCDLVVALRQQQGRHHQQQQQQQQQLGREGRWREAGGSRGGANAAAPYAAVLHACAQMLLVEGDLAMAEELLLAVEAVEPNNGHMCHTRGLLCQREGTLTAAEQWFRRGLDCRTSCDGALLCYEGLAELLAFQGRKEEARGVWQAGAAAVQPPTSRFLRQAALFEKKERNWTAAAALFADAVRRDPQDYRSWLQWGVFESRQRNWEAAERCFQRGTSVAPGYPYLWLAYVSSLVAQRRISDARIVLRTATQHCPRHAQLWMEWALVEAAAGNAEMARQLFERGAEVPSNYQHEPLYQAWAAFEAKMGNGDFAAQLIQRAEQVAQDHTARRLAAEIKAVSGSDSGGKVNAAR